MEHPRENDRVTHPMSLLEGIIYITIGRAVIVESAPPVLEGQTLLPGSPRSE